MSGKLRVAVAASLVNARWRVSASRRHLGAAFVGIVLVGLLVQASAVVASARNVRPPAELPLAPLQGYGGGGGGGGGGGFVAVPTPVPTPEGTRMVRASEGGTIRSPDAGPGAPYVSLALPPGALARDATVSVGGVQVLPPGEALPFDAPLPPAFSDGGRTSLSAWFEMTAVISSGELVENFLEPAIVRVLLPAETRALAEDGGSVSLRFFSTATRSWRAVTSEVGAGGLLTAEIPHLSVWGLFVTKRVLSGTIPNNGFGLVVFGGGTLGELVAATGCPRASLVLWASYRGDFVPYIPGTNVTSVNDRFLQVFPLGSIRPNTPFLGRCLVER